MHILSDMVNSPYCRIAYIKKLQREIYQHPCLFNGLILLN